MIPILIPAPWFVRPVDQVAAAFATSAAASLPTVDVAPASTSRTPGSVRRRPTALFGTTTAAPLSTIRYRQRIRAPGMASWSPAGAPRGGGGGGGGGGAGEERPPAPGPTPGGAALPLAPVRPATGGAAR